MKKIISLFTAFCLLVSSTASAFPHGGTSTYTSFIPSPTTIFNFMTGTLDSRVTYTRSGNAWYFDNTGTLQVASTNTPRFDYQTPVSPTLCGLEIEEARTNNALYSRNLTGAAWTATNATVAQDQIGVDGISNSASSMTATSANGNVTQAITIAGATQEYSVFLKRITGTGNVQLTTNGGTNWTTFPITSGWVRYSLAAAANPTIGIRLATSGDKIAVDIAQLETGIDYTSPIPTTAGTTVTRNQDVAVVSSLSPWFNATSGTLEAEWIRSNLLSNAVDYAVSIDDGTGSNNISINSNTNIPNARTIISNTTYQSAGQISQTPANSLMKGATSYISTGGSFAANSNADLVSTQFNSIPSTDISHAGVPTGLTTMRIGNTQALNRTLDGCVQKIKYYSGTLPTAQQIASTYPDGSGTNIGTVSANLASTSNTISPEFVGFSVTTTDVINDAIFTPSNTSLSGLISTLGSHVFWRIGGIPQDSITPPALTQIIANHAAGFASAAGISDTSYGLDVMNNSPSVAVTQAGYILNAFPSNTKFAIGNEVSAELTKSAWNAAFNSYASALTAAYPTIQYDATEDADSLLQPWINGTSLGIGGMNIVTNHFYQQVAGFPPPVTVTSVLGQIPAYDFAQVFPGNTVSNPTYASGKLAMAEGAMNAKGGTQGITDRAVAGTWYLQAAIKTAALGYIGWYNNNVLLAGGGGSYSHIGYYNTFTNLTPGATTWYPTPMFYGLWLMSKITGQQIVANTISGLPAAVTAIATKNGNGNANILINNADQSNYAVVTPNQTAAWTTAKVYIYQPNSCTDNSPVVNGSPITAGGASVPSATTLVSGASLSIPPCGAALVQIQP